MSLDEMIRAWKEPDFRNTLPLDALASLPTHPAGVPGMLRLGDETNDEYADLFGLGSCCPNSREPACCPCDTNDDCCTGD